jgi:hypothetical protein
MSVENASKSMCGTSLLKTDLFTQFDLALARGDATEIRFKVNVAHLLECLAIYGKDALPLTSLFMSYDEADGCVAARGGECGGGWRVKWMPQRPSHRRPGTHSSGPCTGRARSFAPLHALAASCACCWRSRA